MGEIRIIAGESRGKLLKTFKNDNSVRPLLSRIKKSLFDIIRLKLQNSKFLDLYAGTGSVGIEALSRGADFVMFIDSDIKCIDLIRKNLSILNYTEKSKLIQADIIKGLNWLNTKFDIIYLGPPYKDARKNPLNLTNRTLDIIGKSEILNKDCWIISQHHKKEPIKIPQSFELVRKGVYGDTVIDFYKVNNV